MDSLLFYGTILSGLQLGGTFCAPSLTPPARTRVAIRRSAPAVAVRLNKNDIEESPVFESIEDLEDLTVVRLKAELKARGLKQSGKKADLVRALAAAPGVLLPQPPSSPPSKPPPPPPPPPQPDNVLSEEEVARWMEGEAVQSPRQHPPRRSSTKKPRGKARSVPLPAVVAEEVLGGLPAAKTFSASRLGSAAAAEELIRDAELSEARPARAAGEARWANHSPTGDHARTPPGGASGAMPPPPPQQPPLLPGPTEDMRQRAVILDLLDRVDTTFELEEGLQPALAPRSDVYVVSTKKALRPWDGPHADRAETHVVVLLTDVFGHRDSFTRNTADQIAEICDAIVVVPDMFRGRPWNHEQPEGEYDGWRDSHDPGVVAADIRACVDFARKKYKPTSLGLVGFCFGGGRALEEAAAGAVEPDNVVVFYPTRYDVDEVAPRVSCPVAAFFAEHDVLPGATVEDAHALREKLQGNENVSDFQVKLCPGAGHGFAHRPMKNDEENAADAMLLATSWLEIYLQKHFATQPGGVKESEFGFWDLPATTGVR
eukprot:g9065.t1